MAENKCSQSHPGIYAHQVALKSGLEQSCSSGQWIFCRIHHIDLIFFSYECLKYLYYQFVEHQTLIAVKMLSATLLKYFSSWTSDLILICDCCGGSSGQTLYSPCTKPRVFVKDPLYLGLLRSSCQTGDVGGNSCFRGNNIFTRSCLPNVPNTNNVHLKSPHAPSILMQPIH